MEKYKDLTNIDYENIQDLKERLYNLYQSLREGDIDTMAFAMREEVIEDEIDEILSKYE